MDIQEQNVTLVTKDLMGQVSNGFLIIKCQLKSLRALEIRIPNSSTTQNQIQHHGRWIAYLFFDTKEDQQI